MLCCAQKLNKAPAHFRAALEVELPLSFSMVRGRAAAGLEGVAETQRVWYYLFAFVALEFLLTRSRRLPGNSWRPFFVTRQINQDTNSFPGGQVPPYE